MSGSFVNGPAWKWGSFGVAGILVFGALLVGFFSGPASDFPHPTAEQMAQLAPLTDGAACDWLTNFAEKLHHSKPNHQALLIQPFPGKEPLVVTNVRDDDGNEESTHWPVPWEAVTQALNSNPTQTVTAKGSWQGIPYVHTIIPVDATGERYLLVNSTDPTPTPLFGPRNMLLLIGLLFATVGFLVPTE